MPWQENASLKAGLAERPEDGGGTTAVGTTTAPAASVGAPSAEVAELRKKVAELRAELAEEKGKVVVAAAAATDGEAVAGAGIASVAAAKDDELAAELAGSREEVQRLQARVAELEAELETERTKSAGLDEQYKKVRDICNKLSKKVAAQGAGIKVAAAGAASATGATAAASKATVLLSPLSPCMHVPCASTRAYMHTCTHAYMYANLHTCALHIKQGWQGKGEASLHVRN